MCAFGPTPSLLSADILYDWSHSIIMMNHHYEVDWLAGWMCADRASVLGNCRVIAKKVLGLTPVMGWSWFVSDGILIHRNWDKDKDILANSIKLV